MRSFFRLVSSKQDSKAEPPTSELILWAGEAARIAALDILYSTLICRRIPMGSMMIGCRVEAQHKPLCVGTCNAGCDAHPVFPITRNPNVSRQRPEPKRKMILEDVDV